MKRPVAVLTLLALVAVVFAGCLDNDPVDPSAATDRTFAAYDEIVWNATDSWSQTATASLYTALESVVTTVPSFDGTDIQLGIFRPNIPGCPTDVTWDGEALPEECQTPVIIDSGPYYSPNSIGTESTRPPIALWFVPHGYTVIQMSVRGTGGSGGCMEFMSMNEQKDVDHVVTLAGEAPWSNGNVAMMGRSYDGTTPFMAAALGNPYLKTIVPISGVSDVPDLMFSNGTSEFRGPIMHSVVYWLTYGIQAEPMQTKDSQVCQELVEGQAVGAYTLATGDWDNAGQSDYWQERRWRDAIVEEYNGSMFIVQGMQDWNVNPRMVVPWINDLQDAGIEVKAWLGQWGHAYPDRSDEHENTRWDWAEVTLRWFEKELKGADVDTGPAIEVEDHRHDWWAMDSYPARDLEWQHLVLNGDGTMTNASKGGGMSPVGSVAGEEHVQSLSLTSEPLEGPVRISGLVRLDLKVTPTTPTGSNVYVNLYDVYPDGRTQWIGHAWINLAYHKGTMEQQTLVPGQTVLAKMESEPLEAYLPDGHRVRMTIHHEASGPNADVVAVPARGPFLVHHDGDSVLKLPRVEDFTQSPYDDPNA